MGWLGWLNFVLLQWFMIRLAKVVDGDDRLLGWKFLVGVIPLTGWWSAYVYIHRPRA